MYCNPQTTNVRRVRVKSGVWEPAGSRSGSVNVMVNVGWLALQSRVLFRTRDAKWPKENTCQRR